MAIQNGAVTETKTRKSVSFTDDAEIVHGNGKIEQTNGLGDKSTNEAHSTGELFL